MRRLQRLREWFFHDLPVAILDFLGELDGDAMGATTHVAGPYLGFKKESRIIQRCMCCGEKLIDADPSRCMVPSDQADRSFATFKTGDLVEVSGDGQCTRFSVVGSFDQPDAFPENFCLALVEK